MGYSKARSTHTCGVNSPNDLNSPIWSLHRCGRSALRRVGNGGDEYVLVCGGFGVRTAQDGSERNEPLGVRVEAESVLQRRQARSPGAVDRTEDDERDGECDLRPPKPCRRHPASLTSDVAGNVARFLGREHQAMQGRRARS